MAGALSRMATACWWAVVALQVHERRVLPRVVDVEPADDPVLPVVAVAPARNEAAGVAGCVRGLLDQHPPLAGVVVVDDDSTDDTAGIATREGSSDPRLRVVPAGPLPDGWVGKSWACHRGVQEGPPSEWLLFCDADVHLRGDAVARALTLARREGRGGVTLMPRVVTGTRAERWVMPAAVVAIATLVAPGPLARRPGTPVAIAAGGFIMIERALYERVGGHGAQRGEMVDDVTLALRVKAAGGLLVVARGEELAHLRMYHGARDMWRGWRKNASFAQPGGPVRSLVGAGLVAATTLAPWVTAAAAIRRGRHRDAAWALGGVTAQFAAQRLTAPAVPTPARDAPTMPLGFLVLCAAAVTGSVDRLTGRGPVWRGRRYPAAT